jgi:hypothetical protein
MGTFFVVLARASLSPPMGRKDPWARGLLLTLSLLGLLACGEPTATDRLRYVRTGVEQLVRRDAPRPPDRPVLLPARRERMLTVPEHTIGPFDFLATIGCRLSEVVAARNSSLGRVLRPTRRLAYELDVILALETCIPTLGAERAERLSRILEERQAALPRHVWNALWLDEEVERFLSSGPAALIGGRSRRDGGRQLAMAAAALRSRDVDALEDALEQLRDDPAAGPRLREASGTTRELEAIAALVSSVPVERCSAVARRLVVLFTERFVPVRGALAELDRDAHVLVSGLRAAFDAVGEVEPDAAMRAYRLATTGNGEAPGIEEALRSAIVAHAEAWSGVLGACDSLPGPS